jgi:hypothetical protein
VVDEVNVDPEGSESRYAWSAWVAGWLQVVSNEVGPGAGGTVVVVVVDPGPLPAATVVLVTGTVVVVVVVTPVVDVVDVLDVLVERVVGLTVVTVVEVTEDAPVDTVVVEVVVERGDVVVVTVVVGDTTVVVVLVAAPCAPGGTCPVEAPADDADVTTPSPDDAATAASTIPIAAIRPACGRDRPRRFLCTSCPRCIAPHVRPPWLRTAWQRH